MTVHGLGAIDDKNIDAYGDAFALPASARQSPPSCARMPLPSNHRVGPVCRGHVVWRHQVPPQAEARAAA
eukprot:7167901-Prymnesium_polylepis.1